MPESLFANSWGYPGLLMCQPCSSASFVQCSNLLLAGMFDWWCLKISGACWLPPLNSSHVTNACVRPRLVSQAKNSLLKLIRSAVVCTLVLWHFFLCFSHQPLYDETFSVRDPSLMVVFRMYWTSSCKSVASMKTSPPSFLTITHKETGLCNMFYPVSCRGHSFTLGICWVA